MKSNQSKANSANYLFILYKEEEEEKKISTLLAMFNSKILSMSHASIMSLKMATSFSKRLYQYIFFYIYITL